MPHQNPESPSNPQDTERQLIGLLLGFQDSLFNQYGLVSILRAWNDLGQSLFTIGVEQGSLDSDQVKHLNELVLQALTDHGDDARQLLLLLSEPVIGAQESDDLRSAPADRFVGELVEKLMMATLPPKSDDDIHSSDGAAFKVQAERFSRIRKHKVGGLGVIYVARDREVPREVALKEMSPASADCQADRERFLFEANITGGLEHPGIVPVYGAGTYGDGRPFYAMQFIRGQSLKEEIDSFFEKHVDSPDTWRLPSKAFHSLEFRQLLTRFVGVCNAVAYAHSRSIIHRDIKPDNIMLGRFGVTLVVDWGLTKVTTSLAREEQAESAKPVALNLAQTAPNSTCGSPAYMSPEQASGHSELVGPKTDVYLLGGTLYHLLVGHPPHRGASALEVLQNIQQGAAVPSPSNENPAVPPALSAICVKAMQAKSTDRYTSCAELTSQLECYLADEPVEAYPEPLFVRVRRWLRKHQRIATSLAVSFLVAVILGAVSTWFVNRERLKEAKAREESEDVTQFLITVFRRPDPSLSGRTLTMADALARSADELKLSAVLDAERKFRLLNALGQSFYGLGEYRRALDAFEQARSIADAHFKENDARRFTAASNVAACLRELGNGQDAIPLAEEAVRQLISTLGRNRLETFIAEVNLAAAYSSAGRAELAVEYNQEVLSRGKQLFSSKHSYVLIASNNQGVFLQRAGKHQLALKHLLHAHDELLQLLGEDHPDTLHALSNLALGHRLCGDNVLGLQRAKEAFDLSTNRLGENHPLTQVRLNNYALSLEAAGKTGEAVELFIQAHQRMSQQLGPGHAQTLNILVNLAEAHANANQLDQAEMALLQRLLDGLTDSDTLAQVNNVASKYFAAKNFAKASQLFQRALDESPGVLPASMVDQVRVNLATSRALNHEFAPAAEQFEILLADAPPVDKAEHFQAILSGNLGRCLFELLRLDESERRLCDSVAIHVRFDPDSWNLALTESLLGECLHRRETQGDPNNVAMAAWLRMEAEVHLQSANERLLRIFAANPMSSADNSKGLRKSLARLVEFYAHYGYARQYYDSHEQLMKLDQAFPAAHDDD